MPKCHTAVHILLEHAEHLCCIYCTTEWLRLAVDGKIPLSHKVLYLLKIGFYSNTTSF